MPIFLTHKEFTMKSPALFAALMMASSLAMQPVLADEAHHPDQKAAAPAPAPAADQAIQKMQANTKRMQSQLEQMAKSKDPKQRQKLMQEHMQTMQENMMAGKNMMGGKMDCPMMKEGMKDGSMGMMGQGGMGPEAMMERMQKMEKRMDMMEQMAKPQGPPTSAK